MGGGGYGVLCLRQINSCRKVPLQVNFFRYTFCIAFYESSVSSNVSIENGEMDAGFSFNKYVEKYCTLCISYSYPFSMVVFFCPFFRDPVECRLFRHTICCLSLHGLYPVSTHPRSPHRQTKKSGIGRLALISFVTQYFITGSVTVCNEK